MSSFIPTSLFKRFKIHFWLFFIFSLYLLTIPNLNALLIPCLAFHPGNSYTYADCNLVKTLDQFMFLALVGFGVAVLTLFIIRPKKGFRTLILFALVLALEIITSYHWYIKSAEAQVKRAPLILESVRNLH